MELSFFEWVPQGSSFNECVPPGSIPEDEPAIELVTWSARKVVSFSRTDSEVDLGNKDDLSEIEALLEDVFVVEISKSDTPAVIKAPSSSLTRRAASARVSSKESEIMLSH